MHTFRRTDSDINARLRVYRWSLALISLLGFLITGLLQFDSSIPSAFSTGAMAMLLTSFLFTDGFDLDEVTVSEGNVRYGNRVYPIDKIVRVKTRKVRSGDISLRIWATDMDSLSIPVLPGLDQFVTLLQQQNPSIEVLQK